MKFKSLLASLLVGVVVVNFAPGTHAQGSAFTYQGRLTDKGAPANGSYDLRFILRDAATEGNAIGNPVTVAPLAMVEGVFSVTLDFGTDAFNGTARWLEIGVRPNGSVDDYLTLTPRQRLTPAPMALYALTPAGPTGARGDKGDPGALGAQGPPGSPGAQGSPGLRGLTFRGAWLATANYETDEAVLFNGSAWLARRASVNVVPAEGGDWTMFTQKGDSGPTGATGIQGAKGDQGATGAPGSQGPAGLKGEPGLTGATGPQGPKGDVGLTGLPGSKGDKGDPGVAGAQGLPGPRGLTFRGGWLAAANYLTDDAVLFNGSVWLAKRSNANVSPLEGADWTLFVQKGDPGATGLTGAMGAQGPKGDKGDVGLTGLPGVKGDKGDPGVTGAQGLQGAQGSPGARGLMFRGGWLAAANYLTDDAVLFNGSVWLAKRSNANVAPLEGADWTLFVQKGDLGATGLQGVQGVKGDKGDPGAKGAQGLQGLQGAQGPQGLQGSPGPRGLIFRGAWLAAANYLTDDAVQFNGSVWLAKRGNANVSPLEGADWTLFVQKGDPGATGAQGALGPQGPKGDKGDKGDAGLAGAQGPAGATGAAGPAGPPGLPGAPGVGVLQPGSVVLSPFDNSSLTDSGYVKIGQIDTPEKWQLRSNGAPPAGRTEHTAVWTGSEMIVWGGYSGLYRNDGARYNPAANTWAALPLSGAPAPRSLHTAMWTGNELIIWGGGNFSHLNDGGRYNPAANTWTSMPTDSAPTARSGHTAVWTDKEMIIWGGFNGSSGSHVQLGDGARFDPALSMWTALPSSGAPVAREAHTAVWTGTDMIVWGGRSASGRRNDGARYHLAGNNWLGLPAAGSPLGREHHVAVWTDTEMIVWGGLGDGGYLNDGAHFKLAANTWTALPGPGAFAARAFHTAVWAKESGEMFIWGGSNGSDLSDGSRYNFSANTWSPLPAAGAPTGRSGHTAIWTGSTMVIWGGEGAAPAQPVPGLFNTGVDANHVLLADEDADLHWQIIAGPGIISQAGLVVDSFGFPIPPWLAQGPNSKWIAPDSDESTGDFPGNYTYRTFVDLTGFDPATAQLTLRLLADDSVGSVKLNGVVTGVTASGDLGTLGPPQTISSGFIPGLNTLDVVVNNQGPSNNPTGLRCEISGTAVVPNWFNDGGRFDLASNSWRPVSSAGPPGARTGHTAVWTGSEMIVWGGVNVNVYYNDGGRYNPAANSWTGVTTFGAPTARDAHTAVWTGNEMIVWGGYKGGANFVGTGGRYNPMSDQWTLIPSNLANAPTARFGHTAVFTGGGEMIIWGGEGNSGYLATGARYNPSLNHWSSINTAGAPNGRSVHTAVWTGGEMIIWGGITAEATPSFGGRYNPLNDTWTSIPNDLPQTPEWRYGHAAVWTGNEMIIWGGERNNSSDVLHTGAIYNPTLSTWRQMSVTGAPDARTDHKAIWTGTEMIVWGGGALNNNAVLVPVNTGGRYDPVHDTWAVVTPDPQLPATLGSTLVWADSAKLMILWGGSDALFSKFYNQTWTYTPPAILNLYLKQ